MFDINSKVSKSQVDKAGQALRNNINNNEALDTLAIWRNKHVYPLDLAFKMLKRYTDKVGNHAIFGQRLKRVNSIVSKLERMPKANLSRMQDIGGCRVILSDYDKLRKLYICLKKSKSIEENHKDYITYPKSDGYRGIHLIYKCNSKNLEFNGLKIELQIRTKLQHAWATAVEIIDSFENEQLKLGKGSKDWTRFFYLLADEFAKLENLPVHDNNLTNITRSKEIIALWKSLDAYVKLGKYATAIKIISDKKYKNSKANFFILELNIKERIIKVIPYNNADEANTKYIYLEKQHINSDFMNILMVNKSSIKKIQQSYPNYFADSDLFLEALARVIKNSLNT